MSITRSIRNGWGNDYSNGQEIYALYHDPARQARGGSCDTVRDGRFRGDVRVYAVHGVVVAAAPILCLEALYLSLFLLFLRPIMSEVANKKASDLDERQLSVRDRAHYRSYQILGTILVTFTVLPLAAELYAGIDIPWSVTHWHFQGLFFLFMNLVLSLPASVVAWTEPDPQRD